MASTQVPDGGSASQDHQLSVASAKINTFHYLLAMPLELQDMVWEEALDSPSVLCFTVNFIRSSEDQTQVMCFTPDAHAEASTHHQWALLRTCRNARRNALKFLTILTLYRLNASDGNITEYKMPFDSQNTCLCVDGWDGLGIRPEKVSRAKGLSFARNIKRLAFVVDDYFIENGRLSLSQLFDRLNRDDLRGLAFLFHNSLYMAGITTSSLKIRKFLGDKAFASLFSFQPFVQKNLVEGFYLTKPFLERHRIVDDAILSAFEGWNGRIRAALHHAGLLKILEKINLAYKTSWNHCGVQAEIDVPCDAVHYLLKQAMCEDEKEELGASIGGVGASLSWD